MKTQKVIIKKYGNRRLYDTAGSRYVNLEDVAALLRDGVDVQVLDANSGEDLTRTILTQIIVDNARGPESALPLELLRRIVLATDRATHDFLTWYLDTAFNVYEKANQQFQTRIDEVKAAAADPLEFWKRLIPGLPHREPEPAAAEVQQLRQKVQELEAKLAALEQRGPGRKGRHKSAH